MPPVSVMVTPDRRMPNVLVTRPVSDMKNLEPVKLTPVTSEASAETDRVTGVNE